VDVDNPDEEVEDVKPRRRRNLNRFFEIFGLPKGATRDLLRPERRRRVPDAELRLRPLPPVPLAETETGVLIVTVWCCGSKTPVVLEAELEIERRGCTDKSVEVGAAGPKPSWRLDKSCDASDANVTRLWPCASLMPSHEHNALCLLLYALLFGIRTKSGDAAGRWLRVGLLSQKDR